MKKRRKHSIKHAMLDFIKNESLNAAHGILSDWYLALEEIMEIGDKKETKYAMYLMSRIDSTLEAIDD